MSTPRIPSLASDKGVIAPTTAVLLAVLVGMVGLVTDSSVWYAQRRQLQAATDAAALAAAARADDPARAREAANAILTQNGVDPAQAVTAFQIGHFCMDRALGQRFQTTGCDDPTEDGNAVRIQTGLGTPLFFSRLFTPSGTNERRINTVSTAARINQAGLQAGTGLASVNGGLANDLLSSLTGSTINLDAVHYEGLLRTNIDALTFFDALATQVNLTGGTYGQLVQTNVGVRDIIAAQIAALAKQNQVAEVVAAIAGLQALNSQIAGNPTIALGSLFDIGLWQTRQVGESASSSALHAGLNLMQLTSFTLQLANGRNAASVPPSFVGIPGLAGVRVAATAIEPPVEAYFAFGPTGVAVHTAQVRVQLELNIANLGLVPIYVEVASGDATLGEITCGENPAVDTHVQVGANSGAADVYIGKAPLNLMNNFSAPVSPAAMNPATLLRLQLLGLPALATVEARAHVGLGEGGAELDFVQPGQGGGDGLIGRPEIGDKPAIAPVPATVRSDRYLAPLVGQLVGSLSLEASLLGLPLRLSLSQLRAITDLLNPVLSGLDPVIHGLLTTLGVQLGYVDVAVTGVRCGHPVLVS